MKKLKVEAYSLVDKHRPEWVEELLNSGEIEILEPCIRITQNSKNVVVPHDGYIFVDKHMNVYSCTKEDFLESFERRPDGKL